MKGRDIVVVIVIVVVVAVMVVMVRLLSTANYLCSAK